MAPLPITSKVTSAISNLYKSHTLENITHIIQNECTSVSKEYMPCNLTVKNNPARRLLKVIGSGNIRYSTRQTVITHH